MKSKKEYFENHERIKQNKRLVQSIIDINKRKTNYMDILQSTKDGQNIYSLAGNNRSTFVQLPDGKKEQTNNHRTTKAITVPSRVIQGMKTIPNSNLGLRKREVLEIHKENLKMVKRLADMKAHQEILTREISPENIFWFRSKSQHEKGSNRSNSLIKEMASNVDAKSRPISREAKSTQKKSPKRDRLNQTNSTQNLEAFGFLQHTHASNVRH